MITTTIRLASGYTVAVNLPRSEVQMLLADATRLGIDFTTAVGDIVTVFPPHVEALTESKSFYAGINLVPRGTAPDAPKERGPRPDKGKK